MNACVYLCVCVCMRVCTGVCVCVLCETDQLRASEPITVCAGPQDRLSNFDHRTKASRNLIKVKSFIAIGKFSQLFITVHYEHYLVVRQFKFMKTEKHKGIESDRDTRTFRTLECGLELTLKQINNNRTIAK